MESKKFISTREFAERLCVQGNTVRRGLCVDGHYYGVKPKKCPNGRLLWPDVQLDEIINGDINQEAR